MASSPKSKAQIWRVLTVILAFLLTFSIGATVITSQYANKINGFLNISGSKLVETGDPTETQIYYESDYSSAEEVWEHNSDVAKRLEAEGAALLKNENSALPLSKGAKVTVFGRSSVDLVKAKDSNSGGTNIDLKEQFEANGMLSVNPVLYEAYKNCGVSGTRVRNPGGFGTAMPTVCNVLEAPMSVYTEEVRDSYESYGDAAIVVISRDGGEGADPNPDIAADGDQPYLELQTIEKEMIREASSNFDKVILLVNTSNMIGLNELDELGVDACIWIGGPGGYGMYAVAEMLVGEINPSGKLASIYAASSLSSPAMQNFGDFTFSNTDDLDSALQEAYGGASNAGRYSKYVVYAEGIYVGYKYYETRYEDAVLGRGNATGAAGVYASQGKSWNYADEVVYPFGYGLSYTTFEQTLVGVRENEDSFELTVSVENTGKVAGKSVVEVYGQSEYTDFDRTNGIEKAAVQLVGFEKTEELAPGATEEVVVTVDKYQLATYDHVVNKGYILEEGDYYLAIGSDSHDALNNILAAKGATGMTDADGNTVSGDADSAWLWSLGSTDTESFRYSETTKRLVTNQFDDADLNYYGDFVTYLTRADWNATYPEPLQLSATQQMIEDLKFTYEKSSNTDTSAFKTEQTTGYTLAMMIGEDYDNPYWEQLIDQMSIDDMLTAVARACKVEIPSVGKPLNYLQDTPTGFNKNSYFENYAGYTFADEDPMTDFKPPQYPTEPVVAGTFNKELVEEFGDAFGEDGLWLNVHHHYAPGANIHRTPYSGRNFEYYSEDGFLSSEMVAYQVRGSRKKGLITYVKHFALNDQEMNRTGVATFLTEQAMREIYLRGFEGCFTKFYEEGNSTNALMGGFNRVGCVWTGASKAMMTNLIQNEWGFNGICDTDMAAWTHMEAKSGVMAGTTDFAITSDARANEILTDLETDADLYAALREAVHRNLYVIANSQEMNGISSTMRIVPVMTWYQITLITLDVVFGVAFCAGAVLLTVNIYGKKKKEEAK